MQPQRIVQPLNASQWRDTSLIAVSLFFILNSRSGPMTKNPFRHFNTSTMHNMILSSEDNVTRRQQPNSEQQTSVIPSHNTIGNRNIIGCRSVEFQTPKIVADYMASLIPYDCGTILEPTPGIGNLVNCVKHKGVVIAPINYEDIPKDARYNWVIMNPPFSPMKEGYRYLKEAMRMTDNIIALLPWLILINSQRRMNDIIDYGLVSITNLPRKAFPGSRIQVCILEMKKGFNDDTTFKSFSW